MSTYNESFEADDFIGHLWNTVNCEEIFIFRNKNIVFVRLEVFRKHLK